MFIRDVVDFISRVASSAFTFARKGVKATRGYEYPEERLKFRGDCITATRVRREFPHINRSQEGLPSPKVPENPTPGHASPHSRRGECIGMRSSKSKTSNSYPPHPKRDVAVSGGHPPFLCENSFSLESVSRTRYAFDESGGLALIVVRETVRASVRFTCA